MRGSIQAATALTAADRVACIEAFSLAFEEVPSFQHMFPDPRTRRAKTAWVGRCKLQLLLDAWHLDVLRSPSGQIAAFAAWLPPDFTWPGVFAQLHAGFWRAPFTAGLAGFRKMNAFADQERAISSVHGPGRWILDVIAVRPQHQGRGHGRALLEHFAAQRDGRDELFVLTHSEPNVRFYRRCGFDLVVEDPLPGTELAAYALTADAKAVRTT